MYVCMYAGPRVLLRPKLQGSQSRTTTSCAEWNACGDAVYGSVRGADTQAVSHATAACARSHATGAKHLTQRCLICTSRDRASNELLPARDAKPTIRATNYAEQTRAHGKRSPDNCTLLQLMIEMLPARAENGDTGETSKDETNNSQGCNGEGVEDQGRRHW